MGSTGGDYNPFRIPTEPTFGESFTNQPSIGSTNDVQNPFESPSQLTLSDTFSNIPSVGSTDGLQNSFQSPSQLPLPDSFSNLPSIGSTNGAPNPFESPSQLPLPDSLSSLPSTDGNPFGSSTGTTFGDLFSPGPNNLPSIESTGGGPGPFNGFSSSSLALADSTSLSSSFLTPDASSVSGPIKDYFANANDATTLSNFSLICNFQISKSISITGNS